MNQWKYTSEKQNVVFRDLSDGSMESMLASLVPEGDKILPYVASPVPVPDRVSMRQARLALLAAGLYNSVNTSITNIPDELTRQAAEIEWEYAQEVERNAGLVPVLGAMLGLSEQDLDSLFINASKI